jgi:carbon-monoxide dehydrogenase large subunit
MDKIFGTAVERVEDEALITGRGLYAGDVRLPGMLTAHILRSPQAHAKIEHIDASEARQVAGVHGVWTFDDLPLCLREKPFPLLVQNEVIRQARTWFTLAREETVYVGEPVAVIVATDRYIAEDAGERIRIDYRPLPAVSDVREAVKPGAFTIQTVSPDNIAAIFPIKVGDADAAVSAAPHVVRVKLWQHRGCGHAMEGRAVTASYDALEKTVTVWSACQAPYLVKSTICVMLGLEDTQVRVIAPDVGGGFGPKGIVYPEEMLLPWLARELGRPVAWSEDRREQSVATTQERDEWWDAEAGFDDTGKLHGIRVTVLHDTGAHIPWGVVTPMIGATTFPGPYVLPAYKLEMTVAFTNKIATSPLRGTGRPQAVFCMERLMDRIAEKLGLDRAAVRRINMITPDQFPYDVGIVGRDGSHVKYDSGDYPELQKRTLEKIGYADFPGRQEKAFAERSYIGLGMANMVEATGLGPYEGATVRVLQSGRIGVFTSAAAQGQGHRTILAQVAAEALGIAFDEIVVTAGDTAHFPIGVGTFASRVTVNAGSSVHQAATQLRSRILKLAAGHMGVAEDQLQLDPGKVSLKAGVVASEGKPAQMPLAQLLKLSRGVPGFTSEDPGEPGLTETAFFAPPQSTYSSATHAVELKVDPGTGAVDILRYVVGHDCGRVINPMLVEGQIQGGVAHGIGNALYEFMDYDENAQPQTATLEEYLLPAILDVPAVEMVEMEFPSPNNPIGVKGAGEAGTIAAAAAIIGAIENALMKAFGVRVYQQPLTAQRIVELIAEAHPSNGATKTADSNAEEK